MPQSDQLQFSFMRDHRHVSIHDRIVANKGLIWIAVAKLHLRADSEDEKEEIWQYGLIGLWKAAQKFDPGLGFAFSTYAMKAIVFQLKRYLHDKAIERKHNLARLSLDQIKEDLGESCESESPSRVSQEDLNYLNARLDILPEREREVIRLRYFSGFTLDECGRLIGVSRERVRQIEAVAIARMKEGVQRREGHFCKMAIC